MRKPNYGRPQDEQDGWRDEPCDDGEEDNNREWIEWHLGEKALERLCKIIGKYELQGFDDLILRSLRVVLFLEKQQNSGQPLAFITALESQEGANPKVKRVNGVVAVLETLMDEAGYKE